MFYQSFSRVAACPAVLASRFYLFFVFLSKQPFLTKSHKKENVQRVLLVPSASPLHVLTRGVYLCLSSVPVACCSHRGLEYPRPHSIGSGSTASTTLSQSSSSSGRGSLSPAGYLGSPLQGAETSLAAWSSPEGAGENELNGHHHHLHKPLLHHSCEQWKVHPRLSKFRTNSIQCQNSNYTTS